jgi:probable HAF family extracellular repeat protein
VDSSLLKNHLLEHTVIINNCFKFPDLILRALLITSLCLANHASALETRSFLVDLNSKTVTEIGTLGGIYTGVHALNDAGQVVGSSSTAADPYAPVHAFITGPDGIGMRDLGTFGGSLSHASGINNAGQVAGWSWTAENTTHAFITGPNGMGMRDVGTLGDYYYSDFRINDVGQIVGNSGTAFITGPNGTGIRELGSTGGLHSPSAYGINNAGQVVGDFDNFGGETRAFITGPDGEGMRSLGILGEEPPQDDRWWDYQKNSHARDINDAGQVVGWADISPLGGPLHAFITGPDGMGMRDLGTLGGHYSLAFGINDAGQVVGESDFSLASEEHPHAFVTGLDGEGMTDLNSLVDLPEGMILTKALDINNNGQVLVTGVIPEPETYALMLAGLGLIGFMARRKRTKNQT